MERQHYFYLIAETYFETKNPVASEPAEPMFDLQMKLFRQILIRKQKVAEREDFITKDEFFLQCELALDELKEYVLGKAFLKTQNLYENEKSFQTCFFDHDGIIKDLPESVIKENAKRIQNEINNFDEQSFLVDLSELNCAIHGKLCSYDIEFLEDIIKSFNFETDQPQQPEHEPLDLSNTSAVEKIIYLNELGIIDFLRTKPEFTLSTNLMATILSAITNVKATTLQTSLNRLISNDITDKNHPYKTQKTVDKVRQTLVNKNIKPQAS